MIKRFACNFLNYFMDRYPKVRKVFSNLIRNMRFTETYICNKKQDRRKKKKPIRTIVFVCYMPEVWNSLKSVYLEGLRRKECHVYILAQPINLYDPSENPMYKFLIDDKTTVKTDIINAYEDGSWFNLKTLNPDFVFYTRPYQFEYYKLYRPDHVKKYAKVCYIPYGYSIDLGDIFNTCFNGSFICNASYVFNSNQVSCEKNIERFSFGAKHNITKFCTLGYPRFDLITNTQVSKNEKLIFLWIPRFPVAEHQKNTGGHFEQYFYQLFEYFENSSRAQLIIRPHPLMFQRYQELNMMSKEEVEKIQRVVDKSVNVSWDHNKDYMFSMVKADIMIADFSSLIIEFIVMNKPLIYCDQIKTGNREFEELVEQAFYNVANDDELIKTIDKLSSGIDDKSINRVQVLQKQHILTKENASKRILDYILSNRNC